MPLSLPPLPLLRTFKRKQSWVNQAGRVDRSACIELRASELWPLLDSHHWRSCRTAAGRQADSVITVTARMMFDLHQKRLPLQLQGDLRTPKSNAMKRPSDPVRRRHLKPGQKPWRALPDPNAPVYANPNRGATHTKKLALWSGAEPDHRDGQWSQTIRIERWTREKKRSAFSPGAFAGAPPAHYHMLICPACNKKKKKLFMVLAFEQEVNDAELAEGWIKMIDQFPLSLSERGRGEGASSLSLSKGEGRGEGSSLLRAALINRYGLLFRSGRRLLCAKCLGVRWGGVRFPNQNPPTRD